MTHVRVTLDHSERSSQDTYELGQVQLKKMHKKQFCFVYIFSQIDL